MLKSALLASILAVSGAAVLRAADPPAPFFTLKPLGSGVYAAIDTPKGGAGANAGFVVGDDSVLVVDSFESPDAAKALLLEIQKVTKLPVKFVVNTHYHLDHVAGNGVYASQGAVVLAHENVRSWIHTENLKFFGKDVKPDQKAFVEGFVAPAVTYADGVLVYLGSRKVILHFYPGHTGGDTVVTVPDAKVTFGGDLFWCATLPNLIDASTEPWIATLGSLESAYPENTFVPGHGDLGKVADVRAFAGYLKDLRGWVKAAETDGKSGDALVDAVFADSKAKYGTWQFFDHFSKRNIKDTDAELRGTKTIPVRPEGR
jgi:glyoxylase-like metal-dependent hydrolase (beta-lactamase superfamily II)